MNNRFFIAIVISFLYLTSCTSKESKKIPLDVLEVSLKSAGEQIVEDILKSFVFTDDKGADYLLDKYYTTLLRKVSRL